MSTKNLDIRDSASISKDETKYLIFLSFDLVNSSKLKYKYESQKNVWKGLIHFFYNIIADLFYTVDSDLYTLENSDKVKSTANLSDHKSYFVNKLRYKEAANKYLESIDENIIENLFSYYKKTSQKMKCKLKKWKLLGDEVVLVSKSSDKKDLKKRIDNIVSYLNEINPLLNKCFESIEPEILGVKTTLWTAFAENIMTYNTVSSYDDDSNEFDYIGKEIDIGFRLSKHAPKGRIVVSIEAAYLLNKIIESKEKKLKIHFTKFEKLKGIWGGKQYPIFLLDKKTIKFNDIYEEIQYMKNSERFNDINIVSKIIEPICRKNNIDITVYD